MSLIEQAAKRLEELRRAGAEVSDGQPIASSNGVAVNPVVSLPTPEAAIRQLATRDTEPEPLDPTIILGNPAPPLRPEQAAPGRREPPPTLTIDLGLLKSLSFVTPDLPRSQLADEFRIVKRPIVRNALGSARIPNGNLVMVTSAMPGEGKTYTAVNLAMSLAMEQDTTVLLVDGDVAHPDLPYILGVRKSPGLLDLLTRNDLDVDDVLVPTNVDKLTILPAGLQQPRATELLASEQMAFVLRQLSSQHPDRIIVFDSPPLLPTTEARVLASHMGQIILVVAADSTRQNAVSLALATIEKCDVVLMLLNKADKADVGSYYGYYGNDGPR